MKSLILLLAAPIFLAAQPASTPSPDQFYASLQAVLANVTAMKAQIIAQQAQIADLTAKLAVVSTSCVVVPQPWADILRQILASGAEIGGIAHFPVPSPQEAVKP